MRIAGIPPAGIAPQVDSEQHCEALFGRDPERHRREDGDSHRRCQAGKGTEDSSHADASHKEGQHLPVEDGGQSGQNLGAQGFGSCAVCVPASGARPGTARGVSLRSGIGVFGKGQSNDTFRALSNAR